MKKITPLLLLILFSGLLYLSDNESMVPQSEPFNPGNIYTDGILNSEISKVDRRADYDLDVEFDAVSKKIYVREEITWLNKTNFPATEIQFHLYANGYKSERTLFGQAYQINSETKTQIDIKSFLVNSKPAELIYFQPEIVNPHDSTVADRKSVV